MATPATLADPTDFGHIPGDGPLRPGGKTVSDGPMRDGDLPSTMSPSAQAQANAVTICRDCFRGTEAIRDAGTAYLPKAPGEESTDYSARLSRSVFTNMFRRTVDGLVGLIFRKDPELSEDVPEIIAGTDTLEGHWENIDLAGTHGDVFLREIESDAMTAGHAAILVDFPNTGGKLRRDQEQSMGIRPWWVPIKKEQIKSWRTAVVNGHTVLTQIVIEEPAWVADGAFGEKRDVTYRVLRRDEMGNVSFQVLRITKNKQVVVEAEGPILNQTEIPIAEITTSGRRSMFESDPPLLDIAYLNISHYQTTSDYATAIHKTNVPIFCTYGLNLTDENGQQMDLVVGPNAGINFRNSDGRAEYVSHSGQALGATRDALQDIQNDIGTLGLAMLAPQKRSAETAQAKRLDKSQSDSALSVDARALQDGVENALKFHANYLRLPVGGSVTINRDFEGLLMEAPVMTAYAALVRDAGFPPHLVLEALKQGGRIPEDVDLEEVEMEMMANEAAVEQKRQEDQAAQLAAMQAGQDQGGSDALRQEG